MAVSEKVIRTQPDTLKVYHASERLSVVLTAPPAQESDARGGVLLGNAWDVRETSETRPARIAYRQKNVISPTIVERDLISEHRMEISINGQPAMKVVCTPDNLQELALGRMLTEGFIASFDDIERLYICPQGARVSVTLKEGVSLGEAQLDETQTCCTDNRLLLSAGRMPEPVRPIAWQEEWIWSMQDWLSQDTELHRLTLATHSAFLLREGRLLYKVEDIGRHNAIDKVIGMAMRDGVDLQQCIICTSGRVPVDMVRKAIMAGIPVMVGKASPTVESVKLARQYGLTLICNVKHDRMLIYA